MAPQIRNIVLLCNLLFFPPQVFFAQTHLPEPVLFSSTEFDRIDRIEQDDRGFVWLATNRGLFCFDGTFFRKITHSPQGVSAVDNGQIQYTLLDRERGKLWLATTDGASVLDLKTETFTDYVFHQWEGLAVGDGECTTIMKSRRGDACGLHRWFCNLPPG